jgi:hypothetical protein
VKNELKKTWVEAIVAQFEWPSLSLSGWTDGHHENPLFSPNFEPGSPEYNAEVLPKILRPSV